MSVFDQNDPIANAMVPHISDSLRRRAEFARLGRLSDIADQQAHDLRCEQNAKIAGFDCGHCDNNFCGLCLRFNLTLDMINECH